MMSYIGVKCLTGNGFGKTPKHVKFSICRIEILNCTFHPKWLYQR